MALVIADRVKETSATTGTGTYLLVGAVTGFQSFFAAVGDGNMTYYCATDGTNWEVGIGTYTPTTLARTTILASSNSNSAVNWGVGVRDVFVTVPANLVNDAMTPLTDLYVPVNTGKVVCSPFTISVDVDVTIDVNAVMLII